MRVVPVDQLMDNFAYLVIDEQAKVAAVVDVSEADRVLKAAQSEGVEIVAILSTHHHFDHIGGNLELIAALSERELKVYGYAGDAERIDGITNPLEDGGGFEVGSLQGRALFIPAHTRGHIAYWFENEGAVFTGDTLFAGGCGRLFEGEAAQMKSSLARLAALPPSTNVYFGHEYTDSNLTFAATLEPGNRALSKRREEIAEMLAQRKPTVPTTIALEQATNPFLRSDSEELRASVIAKSENLADDCDEVAIFAATRLLKDNF